MHQTIPFTIDLHGKTFKGYLQTNDTTGLPKVFFVLKQLNAGECAYVAEYLGNIVEVWFE